MQTVLVKAGLWLYYLHTCLYILYTYLQSPEAREHPAKIIIMQAVLRWNSHFMYFPHQCFLPELRMPLFLLLALFCRRSQCFWKAASEWTIVSILRITSVGIQLKQICSVMKTKATCFLSTESLRHDYAPPARRSVLRIAVLMTLIVLERKRVVIRLLLSTMEGRFLVEAFYIQCSLFMQMRKMARAHTHTPSK